MTHAVTANGCSTGLHTRCGLFGPLSTPPASGPVAMSMTTAITEANTTPAPTVSATVQFPIVLRLFHTQESMISYLK
jgi:hypothetical protein